MLGASWAEGERDGVPYAYTRPSPARYPWQWYWDSCFAAIVWRRFDPSRSRAELETLLRACRPDGFVGHVVFWEHPVSFRRSLYYNIASRSAPMTGTIQPPLLAWAWRIAVGDPAAEPAIVRHHEWLVANRDLDGDGLLWLVQPDESGLDSSPKYDQVWGWRAHARLGFPLLVARNRRLGWDARRVRDAGGPVLCEVMTNVLWGLARLATGEPSITPALVDRLWDERLGLFLDEAQPGRPAPRGRDLGRSGAARPTRPAGGDRPTPGRGASARPEALLAGGAAALGLGRRAQPSSPGPGPGWKRRYWRGPTWINAAWMLWIGLVRLGYRDEALQMVSRLSETVLREGLREYYNPLTGEGLGATDFAWTSLILEMADPAPRRPQLSVGDAPHATR